MKTIRPVWFARRPVTAALSLIVAVPSGCRRPAEAVVCTSGMSAQALPSGVPLLFCAPLSSLWTLSPADRDRTVVGEAVAVVRGGFLPRIDMVRYHSDRREVVAGRKEVRRAALV